VTIGGPQIQRFVRGNKRHHRKPLMERYKMSLLLENTVHNMKTQMSQTHRYPYLVITNAPRYQLLGNMTVTSSPR
jgi:hypothetical protein